MSDSIRELIVSTLEHTIAGLTFCPAYTDELIHNNKNPLIGGHYPINKIGYSLEQKFNTITSNIFPNLWGGLVASRLQKMYYDHLYPRMEHHLQKNELEKNRYAFHLFLIELQRRSAQIKTMSFITLLQMLLSILFHPSLMSIDIYKKEKENQNERCLNLLKEIEHEILNHKHSFYYSLYLIIRSNWIDSFYISNTFIDGFTKEICELFDKPDQLQSFMSSLPHLHVKRFKNFLTTKQTILYECDNSGEVIFDLFFCKTLLTQGHTIYLCGKKRNTLNDVTAEELKTLIEHPLFRSLKASLNKSFYIINSNSTVIGKNLQNLQKPYLDAYKKATLVLLKGQANFESMPLIFSYKKPIVYLFGIKSHEIRQSIITTTSLKPTLEFPMLYVN